MNPFRICLWFDHQAEQAVEFYKSIFQDFEIENILRFSSEGFEHHGRPEGSVLTIDFRIQNLYLTALNGGPVFKLSEAASIMIPCETQEEIDYYWEKLTQNGEEQPCGWLKDQFGVSWQLAPTKLQNYLMDTDYERRKRVEKVMFTMYKIDLQQLDNAYFSKD